MISENHKHLVSLGVSHPSLEVIREKTAAPPYNLSTKLTGAGGGGCAVTLIPDGKDAPCPCYTLDVSYFPLSYSSNCITDAPALII